MNRIKVLMVAVNSRWHVNRSALLDVVLLLLFSQELEDPVVLNFDVGWQLFLQEDQRVHFPEKQFASWVVAFLPEIFAPDPVLKLLLGLVMGQHFIFVNLPQCFEDLD